MAENVTDDFFITTPCKIDMQQIMIPNKKECTVKLRQSKALYGI